MLHSQAACGVLSVWCFRSFLLDARVKEFEQEFKVSGEWDYSNNWLEAWAVPEFKIWPFSRSRVNKLNPSTAVDSQRL
jgi:hypothetical protein